MASSFGCLLVTLGRELTKRDITTLGVLYKLNPADFDHLDTFLQLSRKLEMRGILMDRKEELLQFEEVLRSLQLNSAASRVKQYLNTVYKLGIEEDHPGTSGYYETTHGPVFPLIASKPALVSEFLRVKPQVSTACKRGNVSIIGVGEYAPGKPSSDVKTDRICGLVCDRLGLPEHIVKTMNKVQTEELARDRMVFKSGLESYDEIMQSLSKMVIHFAGGGNFFNKLYKTVEMLIGEDITKVWSLNTRTNGLVVKVANFDARRMSRDLLTLLQVSLYLVDEFPCKFVLGKDDRPGAFLVHRTCFDFVDGYGTKLFKPIELEALREYVCHMEGDRGHTSTAETKIERKFYDLLKQME